MNELLRFFAAPFEFPWFGKAVLAGSLVAIVCSVVGCLVILRRMAFLGDALSHAMIAGVGAGYLFMKVVFGYKAHALGMLLGALISAVLTVLLINFVSRSSRIKQDASIGIMYCFIFAAGLVLVTRFQDLIHIHVQHFLVGDVLSVADEDLKLTSYVAALVLSMVLVFFRHFQITSFDPIMAASLGFPVGLLDYAFTLCVSLVVVSAISMVGVILVVGLLITPAATAYLLTDRLQRMMGLAALFGVTSVVGGLYLGVALNSSGGGAIMVFCSLQFLAVLVAAPRYGLLGGWLRRRRMIPQDLMEDILRAVLKGGGEVKSAQVGAQLPHPGASVSRALAIMAGDGLLRENQGAYALTEQGLDHAKRVMRAHRLWETYLQRVGTPASELDARAHTLEHIYEEEAMDYLDHKLGHPLTDPHGSEIPADFVHLESGLPVMLSLLRRGQQARVVALRRPAEDAGLKPGDRLVMTGRQGDGKVWGVRRQDGQELKLDHAAADAVLVEVVREEPRPPQA
ncbi:MAG: metal ABC transporter permease [Planctomycetota bacterium]|nr:metal ABC transporter permease [Planctomycetota bacterium]